MGLSFSTFRPLLLVGVSSSLIAGMVLHSPEAIAAERVLLKYGLFRRSVSVAELADLAETGEPSSGLRSYLDLAGKDPEEVQDTLNREVEINSILLDRILNSPVGDVALDQVSEAIYTPSGGANRQAMRSALVLSAVDDNRISLIEVMQNYPTEVVHVDGDRLVSAYQQIQSLQSRIETLLEDFRLF